MKFFIALGLMSGIISLAAYAETPVRNFQLQTNDTVNSGANVPCETEYLNAEASGHDKLSHMAKQKCLLEWNLPVATEADSFCERLICDAATGATVSCTGVFSCSF
jgi:hypothetical protein